MARWSLAPKRSILVHFSWIYHQKSTFLLILAPFLSEAVEDSRCYFFEDWFMKLKIYNLLKPLGTITQQNYWSFYPSELIYFALFTMRHPVCEFVSTKISLKRKKTICFISSPSIILEFKWWAQKLHWFLSCVMQSLRRGRFVNVFILLKQNMIRASIVQKKNSNYPSWHIHTDPFCQLFSKNLKKE